MNITVIEIDTLVNNLAHKWFGIEENEHRRTIIADGVEFMYKASIEGNSRRLSKVGRLDTPRETIKSKSPGVTFSTTYPSCIDIFDFCFNTPIPSLNQGMDRCIEALSGIDPHIEKPPGMTFSTT